MTRQTREQTRRLLWLTEAQAAIGWAIILALAALLGTIYLRQASQIAATGRRVQILQNELETLKRSNADLERRIAAAQSLERLQSEAARLGFVQATPEDIEYIIVTDYPVTAVVDTAPLLPPATLNPPSTFGEAAWQTLNAGITNLIQGEASE